jgi:hypothetical protein
MAAGSDVAVASSIAAMLKLAFTGVSQRDLAARGRGGFPERKNSLQY